MDESVKKLLDFCLGIKKQAASKELYERYLKDIEGITPQVLFKVMNEQMNMGISPTEALAYVDKLVNVFYKPLNNYPWKRPTSGTFLYYLMEENQGLQDVMEAMRVLLKERDYEKNRVALIEKAELLDDYNAHMQKLENILFPYLEKKKQCFNGLKIMWALHDQSRNHLKALLALMNNHETDEMSVNVALGEVFFDYSGLAQKQELIMFPAASELFTEEEFIAMHEQSFDYKFAYIKAPTLEHMSGESSLKDAISDQIIHTATGHLNFEQVELLINALPVDVTLVDENDKVAFFSRPKDRIFPRSAAIIGRDVRNCHPPESVHVVVDIIKAFKDGSKDNATFWLQMRGMFIMIQYFALRDEQGTYKGTLEVSQEISEIRSLDGEQRLLDWGK